MKNISYNSKQASRLKGGTLRRSDKVKIFSTPACPYCLQAKEFLKEKGISFKDINVAEDRTAAEEMIKKSGQMGVPVIEINGKIVVGFDKKKIESLLQSYHKVK